MTIADVLQKEATPQDFLDHIDIADWLLRTRERPGGTDGRGHSRTFLEIQKYISPEVADEVEALIDELGPEFFGKVEKVEEEEDSPPYCPTCPQPIVGRDNGTTFGNNRHRKNFIIRCLS